MREGGVFEIGLKYVCHVINGWSLRLNVKLTLLTYNTFRSIKGFDQLPYVMASLN